MLDYSTLQIVEMGTPHPNIASAFPAQTRCFLTRPPDPQSGHHKLSLTRLASLHRSLRDPSTSLIVATPAQTAPWHPGLFARAVFDRRAWQGHPRLGPALAPHLLRLPVSAPIAVIDTGDYRYINRADLFLLARCRYYFKRELPPDRWQLFTKTAHRELPSRRFRRRSRLRHLIDKLRPISIGLPAGPRPPTEPHPDKTADVFFAGDLDSATIRRNGLRELTALRERGFVIDLPDRPLPRDEFYRRCARAWIVWSPEGLGWDCFRHYEALEHASVPLINRPTIERHRPLIGGVHALFYGPEPGSLTDALQRALADKARLRAIAAAGRAHVLAHHTAEAIARYVIETTLAGAGP